MRFLAVCTCAGVLGLASGARADDLDDLYEANHPQPPKVIPPFHVDQVWFGWQTLLADAPLLAAWATYPLWPGFDGDGAVLLFDMILFTTVSPLMHAVYDGAPGTSVGLRLGLPLAGALVGLGIGALVPTSCTSSALFSFCGGRDLTWGVFAGSAIGAGLASIVDAAVFAWAPRKSASTQTSWTVAPFGLHGGGGLSAGRAF